MSDASQPAAAPKSGTLKTLLISIVAVIAIVGGLSKTWRGLSELFGWGDSAAITKLLEASDAAAKDAVAAGTAADAKFDALIALVNSDSLESLRADQKDAIAEAQKGLAETAAKFRAAAGKIDEANKLNVTDDGKKFLGATSSMYQQYAEAYDFKGQVMGAIVDETITDKDGLITKMNELSAKADAALKKGNEFSTEAEKFKTKS